MNNPNITKLCEELDVQVLHDITETDDKCIKVCALGQRPEPAAGFYGFEITPWFNSVEQLEEFCKENINLLIQSDPYNDSGNE